MSVYPSPGVYPGDEIYPGYEGSSPGGTGPLSSLQIGRLLIGPPLQWTEPLGDPVQGQGGAVVSAPRTPAQYVVTAGTLAADGQPDTVTARLQIRRQLRSLLNNAPLKLGAFIYLIYSDDLEQDGWYIPDQSALTDYTGSSGLATGFWQSSSGNWYLAGRRRTHREARQIWMKDLRVGQYPRDLLGWIYSTDFSALPSLALSVIAYGASSVADTVTGSVVAGPPLPTGRDGGACQLVEGLTDLTVVSYERPESALNISDVVAYDRRGAGDAPTTGPGVTWEEAYGPDFAWNWQTTGQPQDTPVLDNGLVRVRYDATTGHPGFRVDVWHGTGYVEQGKVTFARYESVPSPPGAYESGYDDTWISAGLIEWTPERAVLSLVLGYSGDSYSRERIFVTLQRGEVGATFECYPAPLASGIAANSQITYTPAGPDSNDSIMFEPSTSQPPAANTDQIWSTASGNWSSALGEFSASTANFVSILRSQGGASTAGAYQVNLSVRQQGIVFAASPDASGYGSNLSAVKFTGPINYTTGVGAGYLQVQVGYAQTVAKQVTGAGSWTPGQASQYRVFGLNGSTWTDFGEYTGSSLSTGSSTRVEAHLTQDRTRTAAIYNGARDAGQAALIDSRALGAIVAR